MNSDNFAYLTLISSVCAGNVDAIWLVSIVVFFIGGVVLVFVPGVISDDVWLDVGVGASWIDETSWNKSNRCSWCRPLLRNEAWLLDLFLLLVMVLMMMFLMLFVNFSLTVKSL